MSVESAPIPNTISQIGRSSAHSDLQAIHADYYNITNANGAPLGGLLVLLDRKNRPVRAELQLNESTEGSMQELAQRQSYLLISDRYTGHHPMPMNVVRTQLEQERISVPLEAPPPPSPIPAWLRPALLIVAAALIFGSLGWFLNTLFTGEETSGGNVAQVEVPQTSVVVVPPASESAAVVDDASTPLEEPRIFETNGLQASRNALTLDVGQRVRIRPGYQVALRTEPGATAGDVLGSMDGGTEAIIINGPVWLEGNSDTIVWWKIRLDNGSIAWVAANTSDLTLLEPVE